MFASLFIKRQFVLAVAACCMVVVAASEVQATGLRAGIVLKKTAQVKGKVVPVYELARVFPIPVGFEQVWMKNRAAYQTTLASYVKNVRRNGATVFDNVTVTMAVDNGTLSRTTTSIQAEARTFTLRYTIPGNQIDARADTGFFKTANVRVIFDVTIDVDMATTGIPASPIIIKSAHAHAAVRSATTIVGNNAMSYITGWELLKAVKSRFDVKDFGLQMDTANVMLRPYTAGMGFSVVTPRRAPAGTSLPYDLYFELAQPKLNR